MSVLSLEYRAYAFCGVCLTRFLLHPYYIFKNMQGKGHLISHHFFIKYLKAFQGACSLDRPVYHRLSITISVFEDGIFLWVKSAQCIM